MAQDPKRQFDEYVGRRARQPQRKRIMILGQNDGTTDVEAGDGHVWVHSYGRPAYQVINRIAPAIWGLEVWVGKDPHVSPYIEQVLDVVVKAYQATTLIGVPPHHWTHEYLSTRPGGGSDVVQVSIRQWYPLLVLPDSGMNVRIYAGEAYVGGADRWISEQTKSLAAYKPAAGLARWVVVYVDTTGGIAVQSGSTRPAVPGLTPADIPAPVAGTIRLCAVKVRGDATELVETTTQSDFLDLRWPQAAGSAGASGYTFLLDHNGHVLVDKNGDIIEKRV